jgi:hypothetical protein
MSDELAEQVERGAALLDERRPGWWDVAEVNSVCESDHFLLNAGGRRRGLPYASARWIARVYNPDRSTWPPIHTAYGITTAHAMKRAKRKAGLPPQKPTGQGMQAPAGGESPPLRAQREA